MKAQILITILLSLSLGACAGSKKSAEETATKAETTVEEKAAGAKTSAKKVVNEAKAKAGELLSVTCNQGSDTRKIAVQTAEQGCEVIYTKFGEDTSIASGSKGSEHCGNVVSKVKDNLQNAGFKCE